jgi:hypothetical protein
MIKAPYFQMKIKASKKAQSLRQTCQNQQLLRLKQQWMNTNMQIHF